MDGQPGPSQEPTSNASDTVTRLAKSEDGGPAVSPGAADFQNCSPGWSSAFYEADCFGADVYNYVKDLERQKANGHTELEAQSPVSLRSLPSADGEGICGLRSTTGKEASPQARLPGHLGPMTRLREHPIQAVSVLRALTLGGLSPCSLR